MKDEIETYNPLAKRNLGESVARALLERPIGPLPPKDKFHGAGVYAIYYTGPYELYAAIAEKNRDGKYEQPIYVGKAVPKGARKGIFGVDEEPGTALHGRLREHSNSIKKANELNLDDFACRFLVSEDIWIPLGESLLINKFQPLWNVLVEGFGIHTPGKGREKQQRSKWDMLHPGRKFAEKLPENTLSRENIEALVRDYFEGKAVPLLTPEEAMLEEEDEEEEAEE